MEENRTLNDIDESAIWSAIEEEFDSEKEILHFCKDLKVISEIEFDDTSDSIKPKEESQEKSQEELQELVHEAVERLIGFVEKSESANPAVNDMFGFALDKKKKSDGNWKEYLDYISKNSRKQYLFFMADMKIKATVYYLRIHNFLTHELKDEKIVQTKEEIENSLVEMIDNNSEKWEKAVNEFFGFDETKAKEYKEKYKKLVKIIKNDSEVINQDPESDEATLKTKLIGRLIELEDEVFDEEQRREMNNSSLNDNSNGHNHKLTPSDGQLRNFFKVKDGETIDPEFCDKKYYLFDDSMREICFTGIGWNWLWKYELGNADLFRCASIGEESIEIGDTFSCPDELNSSGSVFYQNMIKNIVNQMNRGDHSLASYSKNPFRDIYKYLIISGDSKFEIEYNRELNEATASLKVEEGKVDFRDEEKRFSIVKKAITNCIVDIEEVSPVEKKASDDTVRKMELNQRPMSYRPTGEYKSFTKFIVDEKTEKEHIFCVDVLNNAIRPCGDIRDVFGKYTDQFPTGDVKGLIRAKVSPGDAEIVMLGNTCAEVHYLTEENSVYYTDYSDFEDNHEYRIILTGKDVLQLFAFIRYEIMKKNELDKECIRYDGTSSYLNLKIGQKNYHCDIPKTESNQTTDEDDAAKVEEEVKNAVLEAIKRECEPRKDANGQWLWNWKVRIIGIFLKGYYDKNKAFGFGDKPYSGADKFMDTCRELYLKR